MFPFLGLFKTAEFEHQLLMMLEQSQQNAAHLIDRLEMPDSTTLLKALIYHHFLTSSNQPVAWFRGIQLNRSCCDILRKPCWLEEIKMDTSFLATPSGPIQLSGNPLTTVDFRACRSM